MDKELAELNQKMDTILLFMEEQHRRQQNFEELRDDMIPIANHMIKLTIDELAEIGTEFRSEDLLFLVKRLLRNTHLLIKLVDQLEGLMGLTDEVQILGKQVFNQVVEQLDELEHKGYFELAGEGLRVLDHAVESLEPADLQAIGTSLVGAVKAFSEPVPEKAPSALSLLGQMNDPQVRLGLARTINLLKALAN